MDAFDTLDTPDTFDTFIFKFFILLKFKTTTIINNAF